MNKHKATFLGIIFTALIVAVIEGYYLVDLVMQYPEAAFRIILTSLVTLLIFMIALRCIKEA